MKVWRNPGNAFTTVLLHYKADPASASEEDRREGMTDDQYKREHDLDFSAWAGKAVYSSFEEHKHVTDAVVYQPKIPVMRSWDFGYHRPAVLFAQAHGEWWIIGEVMGEDMTLENFLETVVFPYQEALFPEDTKYIDFADPAGQQVTDKSEHTSFSILANHGIFPMSRRSEINEGLTLVRHHIAEETLKVHPRCRLLIEGFKGGYRYPEATNSNPEPLFPLKDGYHDHLQDCLRYMAVNNFTVVKRKPQPKPTQTFVDKVIAGMKREWQDDDLGIYG